MKQTTLFFMSIENDVKIYYWSRSITLPSSSIELIPFNIFNIPSCFISRIFWDRAASLISLSEELLQ